jgi:hypothetical protein
MHIDEITPAKGQRVLILGSSRSGKSVLADHIHFNIVRTRPLSEHLMLDTKPRYRAELVRYGPKGRFVKDADYLYKDWEKGPTIPGSYHHDLNSNDMSMYWKNVNRKPDPCRTVILQTDKDAERARLLELADEQWFSKQRKGADRILRINELLDFYYGNGVCISSRHNVPLKVYRAGGERGFSGINESQRARGFPLQLVEEATEILLFHLKFEDDMKFLWQNGVPKTTFPPKAESEDELYTFRRITTNPGGMAKDHGLFRLTPDPEYLRQLSET